MGVCYRAPVRFGEPGRTDNWLTLSVGYAFDLPLRQIHRHEQAGVATLNEQRHLFVV